MRTNRSFFLGMLLVALGVGVGCDTGNGVEDELKKVNQELNAVRKELRQVRATQSDMIPHLENLEQILKEMRVEVGKNGDSIAGLRDHISLTVRSYAGDGEKEPEDGVAGEESREEVIRKLRDLGVALDPQTRSLTMKGVVALQAGALEFACVAEGGKTHESLFALAVEPRALNAGLLALGLKAGTPGRFVPRTGKPIGPVGPTVYVYASWTDQGKDVTHRLEDLIIDLKSQKPLTRCGFVFVGSRHQRNSVTGKRFFAADVTRDLISVWNSQNTILDLPTPEAAWDDMYVANRERMPPKGTPVEVTVRLDEMKDKASGPAQK